MIFFLKFHLSFNSWFKEVNNLSSIFISLKSKMFNFSLVGPGFGVDAATGSISWLFMNFFIYFLAFFIAFIASFFKFIKFPNRCHYHLRFQFEFHLFRCWMISFIRFLFRRYLYSTILLTIKFNVCPIQRINSMFSIPFTALITFLSLSTVMAIIL